MRYHQRIQTSCLALLIESFLLCLLVAFFDSKLVTLQLPSAVGIIILVKKPFGFKYLAEIQSLGLVGILGGMIKSACLLGYMIYYAYRILKPDEEEEVITKHKTREFFPIFDFEDFENLKDAFVSLVFFFMFMISLLEILFIKGGVTVFRNSFRIFKLLRKAKPERFADEIRRALAQPN